MMASLKAAGSLYCGAIMGVPRQLFKRSNPIRKKTGKSRSEDGFFMTPPMTFPDFRD
jgi:hypothetical protein